MQDEDAIQSFNQYWIWFVFFARGREHHVHEVRSVVQIIAWEHEWRADRIAVAHCSNGRNLRNHAVFSHTAVVWIVDVQAVLIERSQCANHTSHHRHRVSIATETTEEPSQLFMNHGVLGDGFNKFFVLSCGRQFTVNQQIASFQVVAVFSQLLDRVTTVVQLTFIAIDKGDF